MLAALLLASIVAAPLATVGLFVQSPSRSSSRSWPGVRPFLAALVGTAVLAAIVGGVLVAVHATDHNLRGAIAGFVAVSVLWLPITRRWTGWGHLCWSATTLLFASYLAFMWQWTFASHLGVAGTTGSLVLWLLELWAAVLGCAYLWELCDTLGRWNWRRRVRFGAEGARAEGFHPMVSLHVPAYNEPPEMVIETLESLLRIDYDNYEIVAIDDNTPVEAMWLPVEQWCRAHGVTFAHLENWPGYKSGALNYALRHLTDPRAELVGVVDADYRLDPSFLRQCAPLFADPHLSFIQAPQDYRDWEQAPFYRRLYYSYRYFFAVSQPSRNEHDGAIFAGTTGLIRRRALEEVGGWDEWCVTEDAELSLRLLKRGYSGLSVDRSFGRGIMPLTFEALKGQRFRWCFGGVQILRRHWKEMMPGPVSNENQLTLGQRWAYCCGGIQWYGDLLALVFYVFLLVGAANVALGGGLLFRKLSGFLVALIPMMVVLGLVRAIGLVRRGTGATWREAIGALMLWQSTSLVVARASVQGLYAKQAEFLRTPKTGDTPRASEAFKGNRGETILACLGLAGIVAGMSHLTGYAGPLTAGLLVWPTLAFAAAPLNSLAARKATLPPELRARRHSEYLRSGAARGVTAAAGGVVAAGVVAGLVLALVAPGAAPVVAPQIVRPAQGHTVNYHAPSPGSSTTTVPTFSGGGSVTTGGGSVSTTPESNKAPPTTSSRTVPPGGSATP